MTVQGSPGRAGPEHPAPERLDTGGRGLGWVGVVVSAGLVVVYLLQLRGPEPLPVPLPFGAVFVGALFWAAVLRPRVLVTPDVLVLRNMLETVRIPFAAVEEHALRQVLAVRAGGRKYVATGVGRSLRSLRSASGTGGTGGTGAARAFDGVRGAGRESVGRVVDAADFVEQRLDDLAADARRRAGVERFSDEQAALGGGVRRSPAWAVLAVLALTAVLFVASFRL